MAFRSACSFVAALSLFIGVARADVCSRQVGSWGGFGDTTAVALSGDTLLFGGTVLRVADITQPDAPTVVGELDMGHVLTSRAGVLDIAVAESLAAVGLATDGAALLDLADPTAPTLLSIWRPPQPGWAVRAVGIAPPMAVLALADSTSANRSRIARIDIVDPSAPAEIDGLDLHGKVQDLATHGRYAFVITSSSNVGGGPEIAPAALHVIDFIRWDGLIEVSSLVFPDAEPIALAATGNQVVVLDWHGGVHTIDTSNALNPRFTGFVDTDASGWAAVTVSGSYAFIASSTGLHIVSVSGFGPGTAVASLQDVSYQPGIAVSRGWAYSAAGAQGIHTVDVTAPSNPVPGGYTGPSLHADQIAISGNRAAVVDKSVNPAGPPTSVIHFLDLAPQGSVAGFDTMTPPGPVNGLKMEGSLLAMSAEVGSISVRCVIRVVDLETTTPFETGHEIPLCPLKSDSGIEVDFEGSMLAVLDSDRIAVHLVDIQAGSGPTEVGSWPIGRNCTAIAITGDRLFASDFSGNGAEIEVVDISNPASPTHLDTLTIDDGICVDMAAGGATLAVATLRNKSQAQGVDLHLVDIHTLRVRSTLRGVAPTAAVSLAVDNDVVYLRRSNAAQSELLFVDLVPRWPALRELPFSGSPNAAFDVSDGLVTWADGSTGLTITRVEHCVTPTRDAGDHHRAGHTP